MVNQSQSGYALIATLIATAFIAGTVSIRLELQNVRYQESLQVHKQWVDAQYKKAEQSFRSQARPISVGASIPVEHLLEDPNSLTLKRHLRKKF
jgi:hypothetical protein